MKRSRQKPQKAFVRQIGLTEFRILGIPNFHWSDFYHWLMKISWPQLWGIIISFYFVINTLFALLYLGSGNGIYNAKPGSFIDAFSFSVQTMATIGYGAMYPTNVYTNILVAIEVFIGLIGVAMITGLMFARFSLPTARVLFSRVAVICPYNGVPTLMFRIANQRQNWIVEAQVRVTVLLNPEVTPEGHSLRRFCDLKLVRSETPMLALSWSVMHQIDEDSPLYGWSEDDFQNINNQDIRFFVTFTGLDETVSQTIHARHVYKLDQVIWHHRFVDVMSTGIDGQRYFDYSRFHDVVPLEISKNERRIEMLKSN
ncbi:MAG: ATP-sensitive inward rectifier potassium channel 10 [Okeania sp. SIO3I5]|uniref:ion channel n=1 Tax=Okeania sp. SIO3I5 TaxID=2607805 RepID=UPI0013BBDE01|nr:ion channel [Okeania sp. SIO3I5]NEQ38747.1 ATP-sensitive inward rectifier potassium channel 10 [Okeania sp. SIO3I5]